MENIIILLTIIGSIIIGIAIGIRWRNRNRK
jgi:hypothetical protein